MFRRFLPSVEMTEAPSTTGEKLGGQKPPSQLPGYLLAAQFLSILRRHLSFRPPRTERERSEQGRNLLILKKSASRADYHKNDVIGKEGPQSGKEGGLTEKPPDLSKWSASKAFASENHPLYSKTDCYSAKLSISCERRFLRISEGCTGGLLSVSCILDCGVVAFKAL